MVCYVFSEIILIEAPVSSIMVIGVPSMLKSTRILEFALSLTVNKPKGCSSDSSIYLILWTFGLGLFVRIFSHRLA